MNSWKAFDLLWVKIPDRMDYVELQISTTENPHRPMEQLLKKINKSTKAEGQHDAKEFTRQINVKVKSLTESCFKQKPPTTYLASKYFSLGLMNTEEKCHVIVNMTENSPLYVYECDKEQKHRYVNRCNQYQVLVHESSIESHFNLHEVTMSNNYIAPVGTVYFFFTTGPCLFVLENIGLPLTMTLNTRYNVSRRNTLPRDSVDSIKTKVKMIKSSKRKPAVQQRDQADQHAMPQTEIPAEPETPTGPENVLTSLNREKRSDDLQEQQDAEAIWELMKLVKLKELEIENLRESLALKDRMELEVNSMMEDYESRIKRLSEEIALDSVEEFQTESINKNLKYAYRSALEWNYEMMKTIEDLEKVNKELESKVSEAIQDLRTTSDPELSESFIDE